MPSLRWLPPIAAGAAMLVASARARADLDQDMTRLEQSWHELGDARRLPPQLVERGAPRPLFVPRALLDPTSEDCTTVVVMGAVSSSFVLRFLPAKTLLSWPEGEHPEASAGGAVQIVRCGVRKVMFERLLLDVRSPRGVFEVLAVKGPHAMPLLTRSLPERDPGPVAPLGVSGPPPYAAPLGDRIREIAARAAREGARASERDFVASPDGSGDVELVLDAGCHRLELLPDQPVDDQGPIDLDADLWVDSELVANDHTESADASLTWCVGRATRARLAFVGARPHGKVALLSARWDLPAGIPASYAPHARARLAQALGVEHGRALSSTPVYRALGVSGVTLLPVELEPESCYIAVVAAVRGDPSGVALSVELPRRQAQNQGGPDGTGTRVAFCADGADHAEVDVEARGAGVSWLFALWQAGQRPLGKDAE